MKYLSFDSADILKTAKSFVI